MCLYLCKGTVVNWDISPVTVSRHYVVIDVVIVTNKFQIYKYIQTNVYVVNRYLLKRVINNFFDIDLNKYDSNNKFIKERRFEVISNLKMRSR
jgi:hypothetical protein